MRPIITIVGATATGKTAVGVTVARAVNGEIISADSMAVYRMMDIGTAKPTASERAGAPFHLIDVVEPEESYNVSQFKAAAIRALEEIEGRGRWPMLVGGTGLYVRVLLEDFGLTETARDQAIRARLEHESEQSGIAALHERLKRVDPESAARIHLNDRVRIVRALEVFEATGQAISEQQRADAQRRKRRPSIRFGLSAPREVLYRRIDERVDAMVKRGLVAEVEAMLKQGLGPDLPALQSLGYKEIVAFLRGRTSLEQAIAEIKLNTRRFAKRQMTWFRTDQELVWIDIHGKSVPDVSEEILKRLPT